MKISSFFLGIIVAAGAGAGAAAMALPSVPGPLEFDTGEPVSPDLNVKPLHCYKPIWTVNGPVCQPDATYDPQRQMCCRPLM